MNSASPPSPAPRKKRTPRKNVVCLLCAEQFPKVTAAHLQTHGYTVQRYLRVFEASLAAPRAARASVRSSASPRDTRKPDPAGDLVPQRHDGIAIVSALEVATTSSGLASRIAEELVSSPEFTYRMADEVAEAIFSGPFRDRLRGALVTILGARLEQHGKAVGQLEGVRKQLSEKWRIEHGGADGGPTKTADLVNMGHLALAEVAKSEELVIKAVKLTIDEAKGTEDQRTGHPLDAVRYTGKSETLPLPAEIPASQREIMRLLFERIKTGSEKAAQAAAARAAEKAAPRTPPQEPPRPAPEEGPNPPSQDSKETSTF
jgi:hypothetical protein